MVGSTRQRLQPHTILARSIGWVGRHSLALPFPLNCETNDMACSEFTIGASVAAAERLSPGKLRKAGKAVLKVYVVAISNPLTGKLEIGKTKRCGMSMDGCALSTTATSMRLKTTNATAWIHYIEGRSRTVE